MAKLTKYLSFSIIFIALTAFTDPDQVIIEKLKQAAELVESADEAGAIELYEEVLEHNPEQMDALWNTSVLYSQRGYRLKDESGQESNYITAERYADRCLEAHPEQAPCHFAKALTIGRMADFAGTRERIRKSKLVRDHTNKAVELDPEFSRSWHLLGVWNSEVANLNRKEKFAARTFFGGLPKGASNEKAEEAFQKALEMQPQSILVHLDYARHFRRTGEKERAVELLRKTKNLELKYKDDEVHKAKAEKILRDLE